MYVILVKWDETVSWSVSRRYSSFEALRDKLSRSVDSLPALPGKTLFRSLAPDFVQKRRQQLHEWLQSVLRIPAAATSHEFRQFLEVPQHVPSHALPNDHPVEIKAVADARFGVTCFVYSERDRLLATGCEEASALSRLDSRLSNARLPWEKEGSIVPVGSFTLYRLEPDLARLVPACSVL